MKIALLIDTLATGGAQKQIVNLTKALTFYCDFEDVDLHYYHPDNEYDIELNKLSEKVFCHYLKGGKFFKLISFIRIFVSLYKYDAIIAFLPKPSLIASLIKTVKPNMKLIISDRNSSQSSEYIKNKYIENFVQTKSDFITTNSLSRFKKLNLNNLQKVKFVDNGYENNDYEKYQSGSFLKIKSSGEIKIILIGRINKQKNIIGAIKAINFLSKILKTKKIVLDIFGRIDDQNYYLKCIENLENIDSSLIKITFNPPNINWLSLVKNYELLLMPSYFEGMSNVLIESMSAGLLVCCSDIPENRHVIGEWCSEFTFDPNNPAEIAKSIKILLNSDDSYLNNLKKIGLERFIKNFSLKKLANKYYSLLS